MPVKYYVAYRDREQKSRIDENWDYEVVKESADRNARFEQEPYYIFSYDEDLNRVEIDGRLHHIESFLINPKLEEEYTL